jgi:hypothetical protein
VTAEDVTRALREMEQDMLRKVKEEVLPRGSFVLAHEVVGWRQDVAQENLPSEEKISQAQQSLFRDIDTILARLESGIAVERAALDALLDRLTSTAT